MPPFSSSSVLFISSSVLCASSFAPRCGLPRPSQPAAAINWRSRLDGCNCPASRNLLGILQLLRKRCQRRAIQCCLRYARPPARCCCLGTLASIFFLRKFKLSPSSMNAHTCPRAALMYDWPNPPASPLQSHALSHQPSLAAPASLAAWQSLASQDIEQLPAHHTDECTRFQVITCP